MPALARRLQPSPVLPGEPCPYGAVYRHTASGPLLVLTGDAATSPDWLGSVLAAALGAAAVVVNPGADRPSGSADDSDPDQVLRRSELVSGALAHPASLDADPSRVAVIGVGVGAAAALRAVTALGIEPPVRRLVLLAPASAPTDIELGGTPPTFLQSSPLSATLSVSRSLEVVLRDAGVAVRPVEYAQLPDAWVRYPSSAPGSKRAVDDLVGFLRRGFGMEGTFSGVVPGWDLK